MGIKLVLFYLFCSISFVLIPLGIIVALVRWHMQRNAGFLMSTAQVRRMRQRSTGRW